MFFRKEWRRVLGKWNGENFENMSGCKWSSYISGVYKKIYIWVIKLLGRRGLSHKKVNMQECHVVLYYTHQPNEHHITQKCITVLGNKEEPLTQCNKSLEILPGYVTHYPLIFVTDMKFSWDCDFSYPLSKNQTC